MTDKEIVSALRGSEQERNKALHFMLFESRGKWVRRVAKHLGVDPDTVGFEDAFCEAVFCFSEKIEDFDAKKSQVATTLTRFTWQRFFTMRRGDARRAVRHQSFAGNASPLGPAPAVHLISSAEKDVSPVQNNINSDTADAELIAREREGILNSVLGLLGPSCREALVLWSLEAPYKEIGERLNLKDPKTRIRDCRERLQRWLINHPSTLNFFRTT
jgi:DNA-directed RNA polymerase specialized sigma24 family protein